MFIASATQRRPVVAAQQAASPLVRGPPSGYDHRILQSRSADIVRRKHPALLPLVQQGGVCRRPRQRSPKELHRQLLLMSLLPRFSRGPYHCAFPTFTKARWLHLSAQMATRSGAVTATESRSSSFWWAPPTSRPSLPRTCGRWCRLCSQTPSWLSSAAAGRRSCTLHLQLARRQEAA